MKISRSLLYAAASLAGIWLSLRYLLPIFLPFLIGAVLAFAAEPAVIFLEEKLHIPRGAASPLCMTVVLVLLCAALMLLFALIFRELGVVSAFVPDVLSAAMEGLDTLEDWLLSRAAMLPGELSAFTSGAVLQIFSGGTALIQRVGGSLLQFAGSFLSHLPDGALSVATTLLAGFLFSLKMPRLRALFRHPQTRKILQMLRSTKHSLLAYLKAQLAIMGILTAVLTLGLLLLHIRHAPLWAFVIALVDAVPVLGTGTVLLPWSLIGLIQHNPLLAMGLLLLYGSCLLCRMVLEPKLLGSQLGLDPLLTLIALYAGFRLWGIVGLILAPLLAAVAMRSVEFFHL